MGNNKKPGAYSGYAIASLTLIAPVFLIPAGLRLGVVWLMLMSVGSMVLAFRARKQIMSTEEKIRGGWMAGVGAVISGIILLVFATVIAGKFIVTTEEQIFADCRKEIGGYLWEYKRKHACWPTTEVGLNDMPDPPVDPWGNSYHYEYTGDCIGSQKGEYFSIYTLGKDQKKGGSDENSDYVYRSDVYGLSVNGQVGIP
jgi:hypothetical protein